jgi:sulfate adenylyltransferase subunit 2
MKWCKPKTVRFRTVGDMSCTAALASTATTLEEVIEEVIGTSVSERGTRLDDQRSEAAMEARKAVGYF